MKLCPLCKGELVLKGNFYWHQNRDPKKCDALQFQKHIIDMRLCILCDGPLDGKSEIPESVCGNCEVEMDNEELRIKLRTP